VGTVARVSHVAGLDDGRMLVVARGIRRVLIDQWLPDRPYPRALVEDLPVERGTDDARAVALAEIAVRRLRSWLSELGDVPALPHDLEISGDIVEIGWRLCELAPLNLIDRQQLLAFGGVGAQMRVLADLCNAMAEDVASILAGGLDG
jgi:Lon protease-like protein